MFKTVSAYENWDNKYRYKKEEPLDTFKRVAKSLASVESKDKKDEYYKEFLKTLVKFDSGGNPLGLKATAGGRITANVGTDFKHATLMNCYITGPVRGASIKYARKTVGGALSHEVNYKSDDSPDDLINIFLTILEQAKTLASEGGYGINFDFIRPRGALIKGTGIKHPGIVSYMKVWDSVSECIVKGTQDGYVDKLKNYLNDDEEFKEVETVIKAMTRKGAMMGCLSVSHPDIEEFVRAKQVSGVLTKFNISVLIDNEFMEAVKKDSFYDLHFNGKTYKKVKARELYDLIMESTYNRAEPGVLFVDNMHSNNPVSYLGRANCTNPCIRKSSLVSTEKGLKPVEEISIGEKIQTTLGFEPVDEIEIHENEDIYRVTFSDGSHQDVTAGHIFHTQVKNKESRKKWDNERRLSDLSIGDYVRKDYYRYTPLQDLSLTRDMGLFMGLYLGDGHIDANKKVCISLDKRDDPSYINDLCDRLGFPHWNDDSSSENSRKIVIGGSGDNKSIDLLKKLGVDVSLKAPDKTFDHTLLNTNENFLKGLVDGLICSDGNVNETARYPQIRFKSCSKSLHNMINHLMLLFGADYKIYPCQKSGEKHLILGRIIERKHDMFEGVIDNDSILNLYRKISYLSHPEKNKNLKNIVKTTSLNGVKWKTKIVDVKFVGTDTVYDLYAKESDDWNSGGIVSRGCGEIPGLSTLTTVCLLGSLNLTQYIIFDPEKNIGPTFDMESYKKDIITFTRMLDNVNDLTYNSLACYDWATKNLRQFGMGLNGVGSALLMLGIPYNSKKAIDFVSELCEIKENLTWQASAMLAAEKGTFPAYDKKKFESTEYFKSERLWPETKKLLRKYGARNAKTTTNPPLGNTSVICDFVSNGIEPVYNLEYERKAICKEWPPELSEENIKKILTRYKENDYVYWRGVYEGKEYYYEPHNRGLCEVTTIRDYGYQWLLDNMPNKDHSKYLVTTKDLKASDHINLQKVVQYFCNQSVSKTCNLPSDYPYEDFKNLYIEAWKNGLNGFTTYRDKSMESVMSDIAEAEKSKDIIKRDIKLPDTFINGPTRIIKREGKKFYIHFSYLPEDSDLTFPVAIWIYSNDKYHEDLKACNKATRNLSKMALRYGVSEDLVEDAIKKAKLDYPHNRLGRMISLCLRHNISLDDILIGLMGIEGDNISTLLTAVRKFLSEAIPDGTVLKGVKCESCGSESVILDGGCKRCLDCDFSGCG